MSETYKDFAREPPKPHQCMHCSEKDGTRCRATAMHNEHMCFHHRSDDIATVIQNDPFLRSGSPGMAQRAPSALICGYRTSPYDTQFLDKGRRGRKNGGGIRFY